MGVSTTSSRWKRWGEKNLEKIEGLIKYDITFDGYWVRITRLGKAGLPERVNDFETAQCGI
jgi:hypothetical protein